MPTASLRRTAGEAGEDTPVGGWSPTARAGKDGAGADDPVSLALGLLGGPWRPLVAWQLFWGPRCFGDLAGQAPGVAAWRLRRALAELERDGLVRKQLLAGRGRPVEYGLTPLGESAKPLLATLYEWGLSLRGRSTRPPRTHPGPPLNGPWPRADSHEKENQ